MPLVKPKVREETTELHHLNPTATIVFGLCDGSSTMADMASDISAVFEVPLQEVEPEVRAVIRRFRRVQLLEPTGRPYVSNRTESTPEVS